VGARSLPGGDAPVPLTIVDAHALEGSQAAPAQTNSRALGEIRSAAARAPVAINFARTAGGEDADGREPMAGPRRKRAGPLGERKPVAAFLLTLLVLACAGLVAGCGGGGKNSAGQSSEPAPGVPSGSEEAREAQAAKQRAGQLKQSEVAEEAALKQKEEALKQAQAAGPTHTKQNKSKTAAKKHSTNSAKHSSTHASKSHAAKPKKSSTSKPKQPAGESPAEKAAREQFAKEEAREQTQYKKREHEEAPAP
jgi:hypothetical protein